jgi:hypothetical protein
MVLLIWIGGIATSACGYLLAFFYNDLRLVDTVFWPVLWFMGGFIATFGHIGMTY